MLDYLIQLDQSLFLFLNGLHCAFLDPIMVFITGHIQWAPLYLLIVFFFFWKRNWRWGLLALAAVLITFALTDQLSVHLFKNTVQRLRPWHEPLLTEFVRLLENPGGYYGFISNHAANTFGLATITSFLFGKRWYSWCIFSWAALVSYSRIYVGKHYPLDIICGALFGLLAGYCVWKLFQFIKIKYTRTL
jgi:undecaprenyl-diphosphatase